MSFLGDSPRMGRCPFGFPSKPQTRGTLKSDPCVLYAWQLVCSTPKRSPLGQKGACVGQGKRTANGVGLHVVQRWQNRGSRLPPFWLLFFPEHAGLKQTGLTREASNLCFAGALQVHEQARCSGARAFRSLRIDVARVDPCASTIWQLWDKGPSFK